MLQAGNWEWYYPDNGKRSIAEIVGYSKPSVAALHRYSENMGNEARAELAMALHRPDDERSEIGVVHMGQDAEGHRPDLDSVVYLLASDETDSRKGKAKSGPWRASMSIEFGHWTRSYNQRRNTILGDAEGPVRGRKRRQRTRPKDAGGATWVPGVAPLNKASKAMIRKRKLSIK